MSPVRARVEKGRLVLDEPTSLPEGTVVDLVAAEAGQLRPASAIVDELRQRR